ncbi:heme NO-binding domain-containing protein [Shewanella sp. UCD-KL12]|uniref:heme NO-binding domain-containing protein n=1 Tax=Shewanella sp. UCD-KL12 TaxID=1917163 RepID=UPI0009705A42|nr:heme NO-binding domain-containing protein [Shewanella sp. UCD-KL12]
MKGILFSEFIVLVEDTFGLEMCQEMLDLNDNEGNYTSVGSYDHKELIKLIMTLSKLTNIPVEELQEVYGAAVFNQLYQSMPSLEGQSNTTFDFIKSVENYIHIEVKKLYPNANPPRFNFISSSETELVMDYISVRCLSHVCFGLIKGCAAHFKEEIEIKMHAINSDNTHVRFHLAHL